MSRQVYQTDVLVIGGGLAGWRAAVAAAEEGSEVLLVSKSSRASPLIMGFNAPVNPEDSSEAFFADLVESGCRLGDPKLKRVMAEGATKQVHYFENLGFEFDRATSGAYDTIGVLGCSNARLVHQGSFTGTRLLELLETRAKTLGVNKVYGQIDGLCQQDGVVTGAYGCTADGAQIQIQSKSTIIATGGNGSMFDGTTYPNGILGDGFAWALRAGARLVDIEFQQFEPCCFVYPRKIRGGLAVTTMLLQGGELRNSAGEAFMKQNGRCGYQVQKNVIAACIMEEVRNGRGTEHGGVWYDVSNLPEKCVKEDHALFYNVAMSGGIDLTKEPAEVAPLPHTSIGGIMINDRCETDVQGLFAAGEVAGGIHGANRIGGCAGTETLVFGEIAGKSAAAFARTTKLNPFTANEVPYGLKSCDELDEQVKNVASQALGYDKDAQKLEAGCDALDKLADQYAGGMENNLLLIAKAQICASLCRKESRGVFSRTDYPYEDKSLDGNSFTVSYRDSNIVVERVRRV